MSRPRAITFRRTVVFACAVALSLFAATPGAVAAELIRSGDKLQITVYNHPELSQIVTTDASDQFTLGLGGRIDAHGTDESLLANRIRTKLAPFLRKPAVDVQRLSSDPSILVAGGPIGVLPYTPGETLTQAIAQIESPPQQLAIATLNAPSTAAGRNLLHGRLDLRHVAVQRDERTLGVFDVVALEERGDPGVSLRPGDTVVLRDKPVRVAVSGEVQEAGTAYLDADEPLRSAVAQVGGPTADAASTVTLTRGGVAHAVALGDPVFAAPAQPGDSLLVPRAPHVSIAGAVTNPGEVVLHGDPSLLSAVYRAGGPTKFANLKTVAVIHDGRRSEYDVLSAVHGGSGNATLSDGDTVFVPVGHKMDFSAFWQAVGSAGAVLWAIK